MKRLQDWQTVIFSLLHVKHGLLLHFFLNSTFEDDDQREKRKEKKKTPYGLFLQQEK